VGYTFLGDHKELQLTMHALLPAQRLRIISYIVKGMGKETGTQLESPIRTDLKEL